MGELLTEHLIRFKQGNECAFRYFYERYYNALCLFALRLVKDEELMQDVVQEVFVNLWKSRHTIESELHLKMFLYQAVRHRCLNCLRDRKMQEKYIQDYLSVEEECIFTNMVIEEEIHRLVIEEIERLPDEQKKVVYLHLEGKNNIEIADCLNISVNTVKTHKLRARRTLRMKFDPLFMVTVLLGL